MEDLELEQELTFGSKEYIFSVVVRKLGTFEVSYKMFIDCEDKFTGDIWRGEYKQSYIEEITNKAKNFKQFPVFVKMMTAALKHEATDEISIDLLS